MKNTKDKILNTVIQYIQENNNIENITILELATKAGIGKSTIYEHFSSKDDIIAQTYNHLLYKYNEILTSALVAKDFKNAFIEQIKRILIVMNDASLIMATLMKREHKIFHNVGAGVESCAKRIQEQLEKRFEEVFKLGIKENIISIKTKKAYKKYVIQAIISGLLFQYVNKEIVITEDKLFELIYNQTLLVIKS